MSFTLDVTNTNYDFNDTYESIFIAVVGSVGFFISLVILLWNFIHGTITLCVCCSCANKMNNKIFKRSNSVRYGTTTTKRVLLYITFGYILFGIIWAALFTVSRALMFIKDWYWLCIFDIIFQIPHACAKLCLMILYFIRLYTTFNGTIYAYSKYIFYILPTLFGTSYLSAFIWATYYNYTIIRKCNRSSKELLITAFPVFIIDTIMILTLNGLYLYTLKKVHF